MFTRRITIAAAVAAASLSLTAGAAPARVGVSGGGGGGGGQTAPAPAPGRGTAPEGWALRPDCVQGANGKDDGEGHNAIQTSGVACLVAKTSGGVLPLYDFRVAD